MSLRAVLLAAGFATRLYPLTRDRPKPLLEVGGQPLLTRLVRQLEATGEVRDVTVVHNRRFAGHFADWLDALRSPLPVRLVDDGVTRDDRNLGALADLDLALRTLAADEDGPPDGWFVGAGDNLLDEPLAPLLQRLRRRGTTQLLVRELSPPIPPATYNEVELDADGTTVRAFREKPAEPGVPLAAIALYAFGPDLPALVSRYLAEGGPRDAPGHLLAWLVDQPGQRVEARPLTGRWFDIGNAEQLAAARATFGDDG